MDFGRVKEEWDTAASPTPSAPQYGGIPTYSVQTPTVSNPGSATGVVAGVHTSDQPQPIRLGRGAVPISFSSAPAPPPPPSVGAQKYDPQSVPNKVSGLFYFLVYH